MMAVLSLTVLPVFFLKVVRQSKYSSALAYVMARGECSRFDCNQSDSHFQLQVYRCKVRSVWQ